MSTVKDSLVNIFGGCKNARCGCTIKHPFEDYQDAVLRIFDEGGESTQPVRVVSEEQSYQLTVNNPANKTITLGKLDKCLFTDEVSKCDCLVTDNEQLFLVEIKTASSGKFGKRIKRALEQLEITIELMRDKGFPDNNYKTNAVISLKPHRTEIIQAAEKTAFYNFYDKTRIRVKKDNTIDFT